MKKANAVIGILYSVSIRVQNPTYIVGPTYFHMQSYEKDMTAMDEVYIPSLPTVPPVMRWSVVNSGNQFKGNVKLKVRPKRDTAEHVASRCVVAEFPSFC